MTTTDTTVDTTTDTTEEVNKVSKNGYTKAYMKAKDTAYKALRDAHRQEHDAVFESTMKELGFEYGSNGAEARKARKIARLKEQLAALEVA